MGGFGRVAGLKACSDWEFRVIGFTLYLYTE